MSSKYGTTLNDHSGDSDLSFGQEIRRHGKRFFEPEDMLMDGTPNHKG